MKVTIINDRIMSVTKRKRDLMDWNEKLQKIIDYVENHLQREEEPINNEEISQIAGCSFNFFQKVFSYMNQISFSEYVRSRKLTLAGYDLKSTSMKVVDISYKYGYDSPTSFTKAFQQFHGISPREARNQTAKLHVFPKMQICSKQRYSWKVERKLSLRLVGKTIRMSCQNNAHHTKILEFWSECQQNGLFAQLVTIDHGHPKGMFGLFGEYDALHDEIEYSIMVNSDVVLPVGFNEIILPEETWAIFDCKGAIPKAIRDGWKYLQEEWLVEYPFSHADCPELEWYSLGNTYDENFLSQIWIPIVEEK